MYSDSHVTCFINLRNRVGCVSKDFHCDNIDSLRTYLSEELNKLVAYGEKAVSGVLSNGIKKFGVTRAESDRRNKLPFTLRTR